MSAECFMQHYQVVDLFISIIFIYGLPLHIVCNFSLSLSIISTHTLYRSVSPVIQMGFCYCKPATSLCLCDTYLMSSAICLWAFEKNNKMVDFHFQSKIHFDMPSFLNYEFPSIASCFCLLLVSILLISIVVVLLYLNINWNVCPVMHLVEYSFLLLKIP